MVGDGRAFMECPECERVMVPERGRLVDPPGDNWLWFRCPNNPDHVTKPIEISPG